MNCHRRCPDCGAFVWVPLRLEPMVDRYREVRLRVREDEFREAMERHVMLNPEIHPTFVIAVD